MKVPSIRHAERSGPPLPSKSLAQAFSIVRSTLAFTRRKNRRK